MLHVGARGFGFLFAALGYLLAGWLSSVIGVSMGLLLCALLILLVTGAGWVGRKAAEQDLAKA